MSNRLNRIFRRPGSSYTAQTPREVAFSPVLQAYLHRQNTP